MIEDNDMRKKNEEYNNFKKLIRSLRRGKVEKVSSKKISDSNTKERRGKSN